MNYKYIKNNDMTEVVNFKEMIAYASGFGS
jgi:hypothetical protein